MRPRRKPVTSLICLAKGLIGKYIIVDLRDDSAVSGKLDDVDECMNITISGAIFRDSSANEYYYEMFFIKERNVRFIHIPPEEDIKNLIMQTLEKLRRKPKPITSWKHNRLMQRQLETLQRVEQIKLEKLKRKQEQLSSSKEDEA